MNGFLLDGVPRMSVRLVVDGTALARDVGAHLKECQCDVIAREQRQERENRSALAAALNMGTRRTEAGR